MRADMGLKLVVNRTWAMCVAVTLTVAVHAQDRTPPRIQFSNPPPADWVHIDGSKNPELIPQWRIWGLAFRVLAQATGLPSIVESHLSQTESNALLKAARQDQVNEKRCEERALALVPLLQTETAPVINEKTRKLQLDCRTETLRQRDDVLAALSNDGALALRAWVESLKTGTQVSVPKAELFHFRQPE